MPGNGDNSKLNSKEWEEIYGNFPLEVLPWHSGIVSRPLVSVVKSGVIRKKGRALDLCCGAGTNTIYLAKKGISAFGLDISSKALAIADKRSGQKNTVCSFVNGDAVDLPFKDGVFDFVFDRGGFHHIPSNERAAYAREVRRVLKAGGRYLLICFSDRNPPTANTFTTDELKAYFSGHFRIDWIKRSVFMELKRHKRDFYAAYMRKNVV